MSRLRHKRIRPHSGPARHLNPPYSHARRHGGRAHLKAEGHEAHERHDRKSRRKHRDDGGPVNAAMANQAMANSAMSNAMANQANGMNTPLSPAQLAQATARQYALQGHKSGGTVKRTKGGKAFNTPSGGVSAHGRRAAKAKGQTMPGTDKFPIRNLSDLAKAKHDIGRTNEPRGKVVSWINRRARALGGKPVGG